jgi:hypothetical protein
MSDLMTDYDRRRAAEQAEEARRDGIARDVAAALVARLGEGWTWHAPEDTRRVEVRHTPTGAALHVYPGGYRRTTRIVASVVTQRRVQVGPDAWDTVCVRHDDVTTEATFDQAKAPEVIARQIHLRGLVTVAVVAAGRMDAEEARIRDQRNRATATLAAFRAAGWQVSVPIATAYVYLPETHPLRRFGVSALTVGPITGELHYYGTPYLPSTTTAADFLAVRMAGEEATPHE